MGSWRPWWWRWTQWWQPRQCQTLQSDALDSKPKYADAVTAIIITETVRFKNDNSFPDTGSKVHRYAGSNT